MTKIPMLPVIEPGERGDYSVDQIAEYDRLVEAERDAIWFETLIRKAEAERQVAREHNLVPEDTGEVSKLPP